MGLYMAFRMSLVLTASQSSFPVEASEWHRDVANHICEGTEMVQPAQSKDQSNFRGENESVVFVEICALQ